MHGSDTGAAVWQALALLFDQRGAPQTIAAVAALAALATCDGSCTAALQAAALKAAAWGVLHCDDRDACAKVLFRALVSEHPGAGSSRQKLLTQLCAHGLTPPSVLPSATSRADPRVDSAFLSARGATYDVKCICVDLKRPSARFARRGEMSRELECGAASMVPVGSRHLQLRTRLPPPPHYDDLTTQEYLNFVDNYFDGLDSANLEVQLLAQFEEVEGESEDSDGRDVFLLFAPYAPHSGGPHFPDPMLQLALRDPPPTWRQFYCKHNETEDPYPYSPRVPPDRSIFGGMLRGDFRAGEEDQVARLQLSGLATVWVFLAVEARPDGAGTGAAAAGEAAAEVAAAEAAQDA